ncbi:MAG TPA: hypothetical protein VJT54_14780 [Verrucomicrobiae bacterium]|nr:hypothetical protein [Verrucomicrobiae bacterium]
MSNFLFQPRSPLIGWFILMEIMTTAFIGGYWYDLLRHGIKPWDHPGLGASVTALFVISNVLLVRHRRWAAVGFTSCWLLMLGLLTI